MVNRSRIAKANDASRIHTLLTDPQLPFPPNINEEYVRTLISRERDMYVDEDRNTFIHLAVMEVAEEVAIPEWLPQSGTPERMLNLLPVLVQATDAVLARLPRATTWPIYGDFQMATYDESAALAKAWRNYLKRRNGRPIVAVMPSPLNPSHYARAASTVGQVNMVARELAVAGGLI